MAKKKQKNFDRQTLLNLAINYRCNKISIDQISSRFDRVAETMFIYILTTLLFVDNIELTISRSRRKIFE